MRVEFQESNTNLSRTPINDPCTLHLMYQFTFTYAQLAFTLVMPHQPTFRYERAKINTDEIV